MPEEIGFPGDDPEQGVEGEDGDSEEGPSTPGTTTDRRSERAEMVTERERRPWTVRV